MKTKSVIYARVSTDNQATQSQIESLQQYAISNDFEVEKVFDESISGFIEERDELLGLKDYIKEHNIKNILCFELSRLGRSTLQTLKEIDYFTKEGVNIYLKKENINTLSNDPTTKLLLSLLSSISELEVSTLKTRMARGRLSSVLKGKRTGMCFMPYGFTSDENGYLVIDEEESKIVQEMFEMYANGVTQRRIAIILNSRGILTRHAKFGKRRVIENGTSHQIVWRNNSVQVILKNPIYKGERRYKGEVIKIPQIITSDLWNKVNDRLKNNIGYAARTKYKYLFKTKLFCGECGYMFGARTEPRYNAPSFYFCNGRWDLTFKCKTGQFKSDIIDEVLYENLFNLTNSKILPHFIREYKENINLDDLNKQLIYLTEQVGIIEAKQKRNIMLFKDGYVSEVDFKKDANKFKNDIIEIENNISKIERDIKNYSNVDIMKIIREARTLNDFNAQYEYVQKYVDKVTVYKVEKYDRNEFMENTKVLSNHKAKGLSIKKDKILYLELYAFGTKNPIKVVLSSWSRRYGSGKEEISYDIKEKSLKFN